MPRRGSTALTAAALRPSGEALVAGEAVDDGCRVAVKRCVICRESQLETANVGDVFAQGQMSVDVHARRDLAVGKQSHESLGIGGKTSGVRRCPPVSNAPRP